jgi:hypothetical protein
MMSCRNSGRHIEGRGYAMLRKIVITSLAFFVFLPAVAVWADEWEEFNRYIDRYYFIDDHEFEEITCTISVDQLDKLMDYIRSNIVKLPGAVIRENLSDFQLVFKKGSVVSFKKPSIEIQVPNDQDSSMNQRRQMGARMVKEGFDTTVNGTVMVLEGLFESYTRPRKPRFSLESFSRDQEKAEYTYLFQGQEFSTRCAGNQCVSNFTSGGTTVESTETYDLGNGKHMLRTSRGVLTDSLNTITSTININYMTLGNIVFPATISGSTQMHSNATSMEGQIGITLKDCQVK